MIEAKRGSSSEPAGLSPQAMELCQDQQNLLLLSVVSFIALQLSEIARPDHPAR